MIVFIYEFTLKCVLPNSSNVTRKYKIKLNVFNFLSKRFYFHTSLDKNDIH